MSFLVVAAGHSGTKLLSLQLGVAPGWTVRHEPDTAISARLVAPRFEGRTHYGEVNSFLLTSARHIPADRKAVLLRNPYDVVQSVLRSGSFLKPDSGVSYVREAISTLDGLARDGYLVIKFRGITRSRRYVARCARLLGIETLTPELVRVRPRINQHHGKAVTVFLDKVTRDEFDQFLYTYGL